MNKNKNIYKKLFIILLAAAMLTAFGCKNTDDQAATEQAAIDQVTTDVTFAPPEPSITTDSTSDTQVPITDSTSDTASTDTQDSLTSPEADTQNDADTAENGNIADTEEKTTNEAPTSSTESSDTSEEEQVIKLSKVLAEIYGTFTNKDLEPYKNLKNLKSYSSDAMDSWIESKVASYKAPESTSFYGITTKALSAGVLDSSSTEYKVLVTCEREEISESDNSPNKYYQLIEMNFIKKGQDWNLDGVYWQ